MGLRDRLRDKIKRSLGREGAPPSAPPAPSPIPSVARSTAPPPLPRTPPPQPVAVAPESREPAAAAPPVAEVEEAPPPEAVPVEASPVDTVEEAPAEPPGAEPPAEVEASQAAPPVEALPPAEVEPAPLPSLARSSAEPESFASERAAAGAAPKIIALSQILAASEDQHADAPVRNAHYAKTFETTAEAMQIRVYNEGEGLDITFSCEPGENILDAAERAGFVIPFSCRSGGCLSCSAKVVSGEWEMGEQYVLEDEHIENGFVLLCVTTAKSDGVFISHQEDEIQ